MKKIFAALRKLNDIREEKGITLEELSEMTGLSYVTCKAYMFYEKNGCNYATAQKIAQCIDPDFIIPKMTKICVQCKKEFETENNRITFCSDECMKKKANMRAFLYRNPFAEEKEQNKKPRGQFKPLNEVAKEAKKEGTTYGKYVAKNRL